MRYYITPHAAQRALQRRISIEEISRCLRQGKCSIKYPSGICECKIKARGRKPGKLFVILDKTRQVIITVYRTTNPHARPKKA